MSVAVAIACFSHEDGGAGKMTVGHVAVLVQEVESAEHAVPTAAASRDTRVLLERPGRSVQSPWHEKMRDVALVQLGRLPEHSVSAASGGQSPTA